MQVQSDLPPVQAHLQALTYVRARACSYLASESELFARDQNDSGKQISHKFSLLSPN